jgi:hypothetical protein
MTSFRSFKIFHPDQSIDVVLSDNANDIPQNVYEIFTVVLKGSLTAEVSQNSIQTLKLGHELLHYIVLLCEDCQLVQAAFRGSRLVL